MFETVRGASARIRRITALIMVLCLVLSAAPAALAGSVGSTPGALSCDASKTYVQLSKNTLFFTGTTYGTGTQVTVSTGTVCQLYSTDYYTASDGKKYYSIYYLSNRYNVLCSDVSGSILSDVQLINYITGVVWRQSSYTSLKKELNLVGDIRVHALQYALQKLGFYKGNLDGNFGDQTAAAVKSFQKSHKLTADGRAGALTLPVIYSLASGGSSSGSSSGSAASGTLKTKVAVNLRKNASKSSARLAIVPRNLTLSYTSALTSGGITWYKVNYNSLPGWVMGTYCTVTSSGGGSGSSSSSTAEPIGIVTITKAATRVRQTPGGAKTGIVLAKGAKVSLLADAVASSGYDWYQVRTGSGTVGYVRGDCCTVAKNGGSEPTPIVGARTFVRLPFNTNLFATKYESSGTTVAAGTVLMMSSTSTYTDTDGKIYCSLYYNSGIYNCLYDDIKLGILSSTEVTNYVKTLYTTALGTTFRKTMNIVGDVRVYALQNALTTLGFYTGNLDGTYGTDTEAAVRNFQRKNGISVDGNCGTVTWSKICAQINGSGSGSGSGSITVADFGTVNSVRKAAWSTDDNGASLFPKSTYATVMDVATGKVFRVYRWSGGSHADCVPASASDTKTMCDIVGFTYNSSHPTSAQLDKIKADGDSSVVNYTWPDFKGMFGSKAMNPTSAWDRRPALLNVDGTVYCVSIYGFPHGFNGTSSFSKSKFPSGKYFYAENNYYGMMCIHFVGSTTHSSTTPDSKHQANIESAYSYAKQLWPTLVK